MNEKPGVLALDATLVDWREHMDAVAKASTNLELRAEYSNVDEMAAQELLDGGVTAEGTAIVRCFGKIEECEPWAARCFGLTAPSRLRAVLEKHENAENVERVWILFDSPGGSANGCDELSQYIGEYGKPVHAIIGANCCSAAYWLACRCATIACAATSRVGSIGAYILTTDQTEGMRKAGVVPTVIASGPLKGEGEPWQPLTDAQRENIQRYVDDVFARFREAVVDKRNPAAEVFDGGIYSGTSAKALGLVDIIL